MTIQDNPYNFNTVCKQFISETIKIIPPGIPQDIEYEELKFELANVPSMYKNIINQFLVIKPIKRFVSHSQDFVSYEFNFNPTKPLK